MLNDEYIKKLFFIDHQRLNPNYMKPAWLKLHPDINNYLINRYTDSLSLRETLYRILLDIETRPVCPICGGEVRFDANHRFHRNRNGWPFMKYCSMKCGANDKNVIQKRKDTSIKKYGVDNPMKSLDVQEKIKKTNIERYGVENAFASDIIKERIKHTCEIRYGVEHPTQLKATKVKMQETCKKRYGSTSYAKTQEFRDFINDNKNSINAKQYNTKKKNNSFNVSSKEEQLFKLLLIQYPDVIRQYKSSDYPYPCDFYIPSLELYIELNGMWTHGKHPYDVQNDAEKFNIWKDKSSSSKFYITALEVWTKSDPVKRKTAADNNLNYLEIFNNIDLNKIPAYIQENYKRGSKGIHHIIGTDNDKDI